jgi:hypothetical protein
MLAYQTLMIRRRSSLRVAALLGLMAVIFCWLVLDLWAGQILWFQQRPIRVGANLACGGTVAFTAFLILYVALSRFWTRWDGGLRLGVLAGPLFLLGLVIGMLFERGDLERRWFIAGTAVLLVLFYFHERGLSFRLNTQRLEFQQRFPFRRSIEIPWSQVETLHLVSYREPNSISFLVRIKGSGEQLSISSLVFELNENLVMRMVELSSASAIEWTLRQIQNQGSVDLGAICLYPGEVSWDRFRPPRSMAIHLFLSLFLGGLLRVFRQLHSVYRPTTCYQLDQIRLLDGEIDIGGVAKFRLDEVINGVYILQIAHRLLLESYRHRV